MQATADILERDYGFQTEVIPDPTLEQIETKLKEYNSEYQNGTFDRKGQLLVFFSGHGSVENQIGFF